MRRLPRNTSSAVSHFRSGRFGHAFTFDTGSSIGEIIGHSKVSALEFLFHLLRLRPLRLSTLLAFGSNDHSVLQLPETTPVLSSTKVSIPVYSHVEYPDLILCRGSVQV